MRSLFTVGSALLCVLIIPAKAQDRPLPTLEQFQSLLTTCAAGSNIQMNGEIRDYFTSVYNGKRTEAKDFKFVTSADFLNGLRPEDKITGLKLYHACVIFILTGKDVSEKKVPDFIELPSTTVTEGRPTSIQAKTLIANNAEIRAFPSGRQGSRGKPGKDGPNGSNGANGSAGGGGNGEPGNAGEPGGAGANAGEIRLEAETFTGQLRIINSGTPGGFGGVGGRGGNGGAGGSGGNSVDGFANCRRGPGNGGPGGNAGAGGDGGRGGAGGNGGQVILNFREVSPGSSITVVADAGAPGKAGDAGQPGAAGLGGPRGSASRFCSGDGRGPGPNGVGASAGRPLGDGESGMSGQIEVTIGNQTTITSGTYSRTF